jgi:hypothetical protein
MRTIVITVALLILVSIAFALSSCATNPNINTNWGYASRTQISPMTYSIWFYGRFAAPVEAVYDWALYQAADIGVVNSYGTFIISSLTIENNVVHYIASFSYDSFPDSIVCDFLAKKIVAKYKQ